MTSAGVGPITKYWLSVPIPVLTFGTLISIPKECLGQITDNFEFHIKSTYLTKDILIKQYIVLQLQSNLSTTSLFFFSSIISSIYIS